MKIFIITEGNSEVGFGHISRCRALYQAFEEKNINPCFIINGDDSVVELLDHSNYILLNWLNESSKLYKIINNSDIVIIDSYLADYSIYKKISDISRISVFIDDNIRMDYPPGIILNSLIYADKLGYLNAENRVYLLGVKYCMLQKEFWEKVNKEINKEIQIIMISFGGNDMRNLTPKIIQLLIKINRNFKKKIVIGRGYKNIEEIKKYKDNSCELFYYPDIKQMKKIMLDSDLAISGGGQTLYELASIGIPCISIAVAKNQLDNVNAFEEAGINFYAGWWEDTNLLKRIEDLFFKLQGFQIRKKIVEKGIKIIKKDGSKTISTDLINFLSENYKH